MRSASSSSQGGGIAKFSASFDVKCPYAFNIDLLGEKGAIRDNRIFAQEFFAGQMDWITVPTVRPTAGTVRHHPFDGEINHFVDCILHDKDSFVDLANAANTHEICFALDPQRRRRPPRQDGRGHLRKGFQ